MTISPHPTHPRAFAVDYAVLPTSCPADDRERRNFELHVTLRGLTTEERCWAILKNGGLRLNRITGTWDYESIPSERRDKWIADHSFTLDEALETASTVVDEYDENGTNYAAWADWRDGISPHRFHDSKRNWARTGHLG